MIGSRRGATTSGDIGQLVEKVIDLLNQKRQLTCATMKMRRKGKNVLPSARAG
jgi:hypothetical protein